MSKWLQIEAERALYVDRGRATILCDRLPSPVTLVVQMSDGALSTLAKEISPMSLAPTKWLETCSLLLKLVCIGSANAAVDLDRRLRSASDQMAKQQNALLQIRLYLEQAQTEIVQITKTKEPASAAQEYVGSALALARDALA